MWCRNFDFVTWHYWAHWYNFITDNSNNNELQNAWDWAVNALKEHSVFFHNASIWIAASLQLVSTLKANSTSLATAFKVLAQHSKEKVWFCELWVSASVWFSGNTLVSINIVTLRRARLVLGWVTVLGRVTTLAQNQAPKSIQPGPSFRR